MASNFDFAAGIVSSPVLDRIQLVDAVHDDLPRKRDHLWWEKPGRKGSGDTSPEDIKTPDEYGEEIHQLDLRA